jgi:branched-chain amino acid transport system substrate-binding protein
MIRHYTICLLFLSLIPSSARSEDIVVGMSAAFTGPSRGLGIEMYRGASAYFAEVNAKGGVHGRKIVLRAYDDGYNPTPAMANTRRLIRDDKAFVLFGYVGTPTMARVLPLLESHKKESIFLFAPFTGAELLREGPYVSRVYNFRASYQEETAGLVDQFVKLGRKRIAVFYQIDAYGRSGWDGVRRALGKHGLKMCAEATYRRGDAFSVSMKRPVQILAAGKPDAIICVGAYAACAAFIRDARDAGLDVPIANLSFVGSENLLGLLERAGKAANYDYTRDLINSQVVPSHNATDLPGVRLYREMMAKHKPAAPPTDSETYRPLEHSFTGLEGFLGARLLVALLEKHGKTLDRAKLPYSVEDLGAVDLGLARKVGFTSGRRPGGSEVYFTVVERGQFVPLKDWKRWER